VAISYGAARVGATSACPPHSQVLTACCCAIRRPPLHNRAVLAPACRFHQGAVQNISSGAPWEPVVGYSRACNGRATVTVAGYAANRAPGRHHRRSSESPTWQRLQRPQEQSERAARPAARRLADVVRTECTSPTVAVLGAGGGGAGGATAKCFFGTSGPAQHASLAVSRSRIPRDAGGIEAERSCRRTSRFHGGERWSVTRGRKARERLPARFANDFTGWIHPESAIVAKWRPALRAAVSAFELARRGHDSTPAASSRATEVAVVPGWLCRLVAAPARSGAGARISFCAPRPQGEGLV